MMHKLFAPLVIVPSHRNAKWTRIAKELRSAAVSLEPVITNWA